MNRVVLRNVAIIANREYLQRVRTISFIISTLITPAIVVAALALPALLSTPTLARYASERGARKPLMLVCDDSALAEAVRDNLKNDAARGYQVEIEPTVSAAQRAVLDRQLAASAIGGYVWLDQPARNAGRVAQHATPASAIPDRVLGAAISRAIVARHLAERGIPPAESEPWLRPIQVTTVAARASAAEFAQLGGTAAVFVMVFAMFMSMMTYGVMVMRSVLDEKSSRVTEVLLCAASAEELMAGKIVGVGAVGITQVGIWIAMIVTVALWSSTLRAAAATTGLGPAACAAFVIFYVLGYLLYSALYAAVGAAFNSVDEAQQWNFLLVLPLVAASMLISPVVFEPQSALALIGSLIPLWSPVLMYARVAMHGAPLWQVALSVLLLLVTIALAMELCARIYRVGILMYGKKPTAREIARWVRYA